MPFAKANDGLIDKRGKLVSLDKPLNLHIGGREKHPDWFIVDSLDTDVVDLVANCSNLSMFPAASCGVIYCSHVLEHLSHDGELQKTLKGFHRILHANGKLMVSVPNLDVLCRSFLRSDLTPDARRLVMHMMYGGQVDAYDFHKTGFNFHLLHESLSAANFQRFERVESLGLFNDASEIKFDDERISLNMIASL